MKRWIKEFFYAPKHEKPTDENITRLLMPSVIGIIICLTCITGLSYAWFTAGIQTEPQTLQAANYTLTVSVNESETKITPDADGVYSLEAGKQYTVTLTPEGTATTGYCVVEWKNGNGDKRYTAQIPTAAYSAEKPFVFHLMSVSGGKFTFTPQWGTYSGSETDTNLIKDGLQVTIPVTSGSPGGKNTLALSNQPEAGAPTDETEYVVQQGDTMKKIAKKFDRTIDALAAYNNIKDANRIQIGQKLKIPPADYVVPASTDTPAPPAASQPVEKPAESAPTAPPTTSKPAETTTPESSAVSDPSAVPTTPDNEPAESAPAEPETESGGETTSSIPAATEPESDTAKEVG